MPRRPRLLGLPRLPRLLVVPTLLGLLAVLWLGQPGCQDAPAPAAQQPEALRGAGSEGAGSRASTGAATTARVAASRPGGYDRHYHHYPWGTCVTVTPPPPPWALRPDGTLKQPSEIHRPKDGNEQILYLNFEGPHMVPGHDDPEKNQSGIPYSEVDIPVFDDEPFRTDVLDTRAKVIDAISRWVTYFYAHMQVEVTTTRPPEGWPYSMMVIGGSPQDLGEQTGVLGIATFDCYQDQRNVGFIFSEDHGSRLETLVLTIVHEAGHTFGLAHIDDNHAIMYPANPGGDAYWSSGSTTDSYACDGSTSQDSFAVLQEMLGAREDTVPPWLELKTPGDGALVPASLQALVHGTDNVVLYSVELFLDGESVGSETLPEFAFQLSELTDGPHELYAVGEDVHGNTAESALVEVEVEGECAAVAGCEDGLGAIGDPCESGDQCQSAVCAQTPEGQAVCSRPCSSDSPCPLGTSCVEGEPPADPDSTEPTPAWCAVGPPPVIVLQVGAGGARLSGCATAAPASAPGAPAGPADAGLPLALLGLLGLLVRRRARA